MLGRKRRMQTYAYHYLCMYYAAMGARWWPFGASRDTRRTFDAPASQSGPRFTFEAPPELTGLMAPSSLDAPISRREAMSVPAVMRARNLICSTLATLPLRYHAPDRTTQPWPLFEQPDPDMPTSVVWAHTYEDLLFEGVAWWRVTRFGWHGFPVEARHVPPGSVHVHGSTWPAGNVVSPDQAIPLDGRVFIDGIEVPDSEIIRFDSPNPPLLIHAARAIRTALKLDRAAALYSDDPMPLGAFVPQEGADPLSTEPGSAGDGTDRSEVDALLDEWEAARSRRAWGYVSGVKPELLQWDPKKLQLAEQRQHAVLEIARAVGVDPEDLGVSTTSRTYQNSEDRRKAFLDFNLGPWVSAVQDRLSMRDITPRGYQARIDFAGFLRSDALTRMQVYKAGLEVGAYVEEEIRELEDRPALTPAQRAARIPAPQPVADPQEEPQMSGLRAVPDAANFAEDTADATTVTFDLSADTVNFRVNPDKRTISGLAVPWNKVAYSRGQKWKFLPGSLHWTEPSRVKANLDHDHERVVGKAVRLEPTQVGLDTSVQLGRSPEAKRALEDAEDGIFDGFSIEVQFNQAVGDKITADPEDQSVNLVHRATLSGIALTPMPAFDDARIAAVAASKTGDMTVTAPKTADVAAAAAGEAAPYDAALTTFTEKLTEKIGESTGQLTEKIGDAVEAAFKTAFEKLDNTPGDGPQPVRAARYTVTREAPVYSMTGGGPSLVRDAWYARVEHDDDAKERIRKYRQQSEEMSKLAQAARFTTSNTSNASAIIPPGYRPDLYIPELGQGRPLVNALSMGTITNATPFVVPVFGSVTGATGDHVEGVNPTDGTLNFNTKTVTPGAVSGRLVLTREIVDSSNPAIDQIALATMRESYARQTEAKVYAALNGTNGAGGVITGDTVPSGAQASTVVAPDTNAGKQALAKHIRERLAKYPFNRFAAPGRALMGQRATSRLATAVDTTERPLFPSIGAENSSGLGNAITQGWMIDGLAFTPAWAMTGVAVGDSQILMLNPADAWAWESALLTFKFEEKSGPALIELALFGYFATHVLRPVGLSGIRMTDA